MPSEIELANHHNCNGPLESVNDLKCYLELAGGGGGGGGKLSSGLNGKGGGRGGRSGTDGSGGKCPVCGA